MARHIFEIEFAGIRQSKSVNITAAKVESIEILDIGEEVTDGTSNEKTEIFHGKEYKLRVNKYVNDKPPKDLNTIKWYYSYVDKSGELVKTTLKETGEEICFKPEAEDMCNLTIQIYAYAVGQKEEAVECEVFVVSFPLCIDMFKIPGLKPEGTDMADDLRYGTGENIAKKAYPDSLVDTLTKDYILDQSSINNEFSNKTTNHNKPLYTKDEAYSIEFKGIPWYLTLQELISDNTPGEEIKAFNEKYTDAQLFKKFRWGVTALMSQGKLETNIEQMISKFEENEGGVYSSPLLTNNLKNHEATNTYCKEVEDYMAEKLKLSKGKLEELFENEIDFVTTDGLNKRYDKGKTTTRINRNSGTGKEIFFMRPQYNSASDLVEGQRIALNDIWATNVEITDYRCEGEDYTIKYDVTLWDHFGLDLPDLEKYFNVFKDARMIFASWFTLQHLRGYKPFITHVKFSKEFTGKLSEGKYERNIKNDRQSRINRSGIRTRG